MDLKSPASARKAYSELVGDYRQSKPKVNRDTAAEGEAGTVKVRAGKKIKRPKWDDESDQEQIEDMLTRAKIKVRRTIKGLPVEEEVQTGKVHAFSFDGKEGTGPLVVHVGDALSGGRRSFRVQDIIEVR